MGCIVSVSYIAGGGGVNVHVSYVLLCFSWSRKLFDW